MTPDAVLKILRSRKYELSRDLDYFNKTYNNTKIKALNSLLQNCEHWILAMEYTKRTGISIALVKANVSYLPYTEAFYKNPWEPRSENTPSA